MKEEIWRVVVVCLGGTPWRSLRTGLIVSLTLVAPDATDVLVYHSSVVTEFCEVFFRVALIGKMLHRSPFLSPKSEHIVVPVRRKGRGLHVLQRKRPHCQEE